MPMPTNSNSAFFSSNQPIHHQPSGLYPNSYQHAPFQAQNVQQLDRPSMFPSAAASNFHPPVFLQAAPLTPAPHSQSSFASSSFPTFSGQSVTMAPMPSSLASMSTSSGSSTSSSSTTTTRIKRPRENEDYEADNAPPPMKKVHALEGDGNAPRLLLHAGMGDVRHDDDDPMATPSSIGPEDVPATPFSEMETMSPPVANSPDAVDAEINTDEWNLSRLKLEVSDQFQPLLNQLSSDQAKRAAGFDASILRELQRELENSRRGGVVKATWDKAAAYKSALEFARNNIPPQQQMMVLYKKPSKQGDLRPSSKQLSLGAASPTPKIEVLSSPIVTEVDDDEPSSPPSGGSYRSSPMPPDLTPTSTQSQAPPRDARRLKRRRESDSDLTPPASLRIEEVHEEDHDSKRIKTHPTEHTNLTAAQLTMDTHQNQDDDDVMMGSNSPVAKPDAPSQFLHPPPMHLPSSSSSSASAAAQMQPGYNPHLPMTKHASTQLPFAHRDEHKQDAMCDGNPNFVPPNQPNAPMNGWSASYQPHQPAAVWQTTAPTGFPPNGPHTHTMMW